MRHTPGPWEVSEGTEDRPELAVVYEDKTGQLVLVADCLSSDVPPKERRLNARLISAAPDLLEACKAALVSFISDELYSESQTIILTLENAISKAEGRE